MTKEKLRYVVFEETGWSITPKSKPFDTYEEAAAELKRLKEAGEIELHPLFKAKISTVRY